MSSRRLTSSRTLSWFTATLLAAAGATSLFSAHAEPWLLQDGPYGGGIVALDRTASGDVFALRSDTLFRTTNDGASWTDVGPPTAFTFLSLDVTDDGAIWAGTSLRGVAWSLNGGLSWTNDQIVSNPHSGTGATIIAIGVDPLGRILAGGYRSTNQGGSFTSMTISGTAFAFDAAGDALAGTDDGVWRSSDGGASWSPANAGMAGESIRSLAVDGATGVWAGTNDSVWRSTNSGLTWTPAGSGLPGTAIVAIEVLPTGVLAAATGGGLFRTTDGGATWSPAGADPGDVRDLLLAGNELWLGVAAHGVLLSTDGAVSAQPASSAAMYTPGLGDVAAHPAGPLFLATSGSGLFRSADHGATWTNAAGIPSLPVHDVAAASATEAWVAAWSGVYRTTDAGGSWSLGGFDGWKARCVQPLDSQRVVAAVEDPAIGPTLQRSTDGGATWTRTWDSTTTFFLFTSARCDDGTLLFGGMSAFGGQLLRSTDDGLSWSESQLGFVGLDALAADATGRAWATTSDNVLHRSTDRGATWQALPPGGWPTGTTGSLRPLAYGVDGLLVVGSGRVFRSTDGGDSWTELSSGLPPTPNVSSVASTPVGTFAGTQDAGLFRWAGPTGIPDPSRSSDATIVGVFPNPFRETTRVRWQLPRPAFVRVFVHDVRGRRIATLDGGPRPAGVGDLTWDGRADDGTPVAPGMYFLRWEADGLRVGATALRLR